jgi:KaiC/GvpD/RAD55 family RecA-like ATPase
MVGDETGGSNAGKYLCLGTFLDHMLNSDCELRNADSTDASRVGGIRIPTHTTRGEPRANDDPGTGNIVIMGGTGTGKTTLALHMAHACCARPDNRRFLAAYFSLEEPLYRLKTKARAFDWAPLVQPMEAIQPVRHPPSSEQLGQWLKKAVGIAQQRVEREWREMSSRVYNTMDGVPQPILVPTLSPATIAPGTADDSVFWERYKQLERFLVAVEQMREIGSTSEKRDLRLVFLDSLTVFGGRLLTRDELARLFDLFSRTGTIGVFIVEDTSVFSAAVDEQHMETIDSLADVVIRLDSSREHGYFRRNLEIIKSRYNHNVLGKHAVRIVKPSEVASLWTPPNLQIRDLVGFLVMPSIHYMLSAQKPKNQRLHTSIKPQPTDSSPKLCFGEVPLNSLLPPNYHRDWVILIEGQRHCFKTALAVNYLMRGVFTDNGKPETVLFIRLHDRAMFPANESFYGQTRLWHTFAKRWEHQRQSATGTVSESPATIRTFWRGYRRGEQIGMQSVAGLPDFKLGESNAGGLIELVLKTGAVAAEKALVNIWDLIHAAERCGVPIRRVAFDDVSRIAVSYPAIFNGEISQKLFITGLAHMLRERRIGLVMVGTMGESEDGDELIARIKSVANSCITAKFVDVYGERHVAVTGEGLAGGVGELADDHMERIPLTLRRPEGWTRDEVAFTADPHQLDGLTGFSRRDAKIERPGTTIYMYEEGIIHANYLNKLEFQLSTMHGRPPHHGTIGNKKSKHMVHRGQGHLDIIRFDIEHAAAMFDAVDMQPEKGVPQDRTVIYTLDEFAVDYLKSRFVQVFEAENQKHAASRVYLKNFLLQARPDTKDVKITWEELAEIASDVAVDQLANETYSCCLLDAIFSGMEPYFPFVQCCDFIDYLEQAAENSQVLGEVKAMGIVLKESLRNTLPMSPPNYRICWYSQLREHLTKEHGQHSLSLDELPAKGFSGDWYMGVLKGSVSLRLGKRIVDQLCSRHEQYERFLAGVGLPSDSDSKQIGNSAFNVLPHAVVGSDGQTLDQIMELHSQARKRSEIAQYFRFRELLYHAACRIRDDSSDENKVKKHLVNLPKQIREVLLGID